MKKRTCLRNKIMLACAGILVFMLFLIGLRYWVFHSFIKPYKMNNTFTQTLFVDIPALQAIPKMQEFPEIKPTHVDWAKKYPFENEEIPVKPKEKELPFYKQVFSKLKMKKHHFEAKVRNKQKEVEIWTKRYLINYYRLVELGRFYEVCTGWSVMNPKHNVVEMSDGYLTFVYPRQQNIRQYIDAVRYLQESCQKIGSDFLFVQAPFKVQKNADGEVNGILDFSNESTDEFLRGLQEIGVDYIDLRKRASDFAGEDGYHKLFYRTDHHWLPTTALWASRQVAEYLIDNGKLNIQAELLADRQYEIIRYQDWFLGSQGKKVTLAKTISDEGIYILPKFSNLIHYKIPSLGIDCVGGFDITYNKTLFFAADSIYESQAYESYNHSQNAVTYFYNENVKNNHRILLLKDSFGNTMAPFLAMTVQELCVMDLRSFNGSLQSFLKEYQPDFVLMVVNPNAYVVSVEDVFDFR